MKLKEIEHSLHHLPLLIGCGICCTVLELSHVFLPFLLSWECGELCHGSIPIEVNRGIHYHDETIAQDVNLHFEDSYGLDSLFDLIPEVLLIMRLLVFLNQFGVIFQLHGLYKSLGWLVVLLAFISFCIHIVFISKSFPNLLFLYCPILDVPLVGIEVDAYFGYRLAAEGETLAIVLEIDL